MSQNALSLREVGGLPHGSVVVVQMAGEEGTFLKLAPDQWHSPAMGFARDDSMVGGTLAVDGSAIIATTKHAQMMPVGALASRVLNHKTVIFQKEASGSWWPQNANMHNQLDHQMVGARICHHPAPASTTATTIAWQPATATVAWQPATVAGTTSAYSSQWPPATAPWPGMSDEEQASLISEEADEIVERLRESPELRYELLAREPALRSLIEAIAALAPASK